MELPLDLEDLYNIINLSKKSKNIKELNSGDLKTLNKLEVYAEKEIQDFKNWKLKQKDNK